MTPQIPYTIKCLKNHVIHRYEEINKLLRKSNRDLKKKKKKIITFT